ncbi:leucine rich repeat domain-containing protein [Ephemerocybe angulata]|uniref:Leucine rich repeat domain-containing protein n=1 Tax=Ephemerocybe angulata TaxID=980116 RepID=A0A8H6MBD7_9AGAR|nr:leucine rich repeat domain-containing protein [Tulosesus angulatus]
MEPEKGDDYLRRLAAYIRTNEKALAEAGAPRRRHAQRQHQNTDALSYLNPLSWLGSDPNVKPVVLSTDTHHLFYVLMRLEALEYPVGTLDVHIDNPSRPMTYVNLFAGPDKSDTLSLASFRSSFSAVSKLSLGGAWWGRAETPSIDSDLRFIYSSFTKIPALIVHAPTKSAIEELLQDPPDQNALPLDSFKNLQSLQCIDIDPRTLLGWDRLAESLRSLTIKKSGLEDISDVFIGAVIDDQARREGSASRKRHRQIPSRSGYSTPLPDSVIEEEPSDDKADADTPPVPDHTPASPPPPKLSSLKWAFLKHLSLSDNALTFIPADALSHLTSLTHLDLSSNLLVSVPPALSTLYNLISLNLSDNMIDSVLGIYLNLGQILYLNLSHNRLESLCGLERLHALERVDLRSEVGRLATLPNITELWIEGNPFIEYEEQYRVGKTIKLDGTPPGFYERRSMSAPPLETRHPQTQPMAHSPPVLAIGSAPNRTPPFGPTGGFEGLPTPPSSNASPLVQPVAGHSEKKKRKQQRRIVEFGEEGHSAEGSGSSKHLHPKDAGADKSRGRTKATKKSAKAAERYEDNSITPTPSTSTTVLPLRSSTPPPAEPKPVRSRHSRYQTEYRSSTMMSDASDEATSIPRFSPRSSQSRSATLSSKSAMRRARMSASMKYRRRIEALKQDMGEGWLKVFSQSESIQSPS